MNNNIKTLKENYNKLIQKRQIKNTAGITWKNKLRYGG
jgi:hypothetical protein